VTTRAIIQYRPRSMPSTPGLSAIQVASPELLITAASAKPPHRNQATEHPKAYPWPVSQIHQKIPGLLLRTGIRNMIIAAAMGRFTVCLSQGIRLATGKRPEISRPWRSARNTVAHELSPPAQSDRARSIVSRKPAEAVTPTLTQTKVLGRASQEPRWPPASGDTGYLSNIHWAKPRSSIP